MTEFSGWRVSTRSGGNSGTCVEVGAASRRIGIRDTTNREGGTIDVTKKDWVRFIAAL